ncbi:MAG: hypothetical protein ACRDST_12055 [Pseudonocardiaceae bacterium]
MGLDTTELFTFIGATQIDQGERIVDFNGGDSDIGQRNFAAHLDREIDTRSSLNVLRHRVKDWGVLSPAPSTSGLRTPWPDDALVQFHLEPAHGSPPAPPST